MENNNNESFNVYCNGIQVFTSAFDFTFELNNNSPSNQVLLGEVKMSPEHAKVFARMLTEHVNNFENLFGPIPEIDKDRVKKLQAEGKIVVEGKL